MHRVLTLDKKKPLKVATKSGFWQYLIESSEDYRPAGMQRVRTIVQFLGIDNIAVPLEKGSDCWIVAATPKGESSWR